MASISVPCMLLFFSFFILSDTMYSKLARSHDQARSLVCCACGCKDLKSQPITEGLEEIVKTEVFAGYDRQDTYFPSGLCGTCRKNLFKAKRGDVVPSTVRDRWNSMSYLSFRPPSRSTPCVCTICKMVRHKDEKLDSEPMCDVPRIVEESNDENKARQI